MGSNAALPTSIEGPLRERLGARILPQGRAPWGRRRQSGRRAGSASADRSLNRRAKGDKGLSRSDVLSKALGLLDAEGERGLTMRALAKGLSVTPMALYHHVGNRDGLIAALIEHAFGQIVPATREGETPSDRIERVLTAYCQRARAHPELILAVFRDPNVLAGPLGDITDALKSDLHAMGLPKKKVDQWLGLLVDYTHGYAVSAAAAPCGPREARPYPTHQHNIRVLTDMARLAAERS